MMFVSAVWHITVPKKRKISFLWSSLLRKEVYVEMIVCFSHIIYFNVDLYLVFKGCTNRTGKMIFY